MLSGLWRSEGYGWILAFDPDGYTLHHHCAASCLAAERGTHADFARSYDRVAVVGERLSLHQAGDLTRYDFQRVDAMPGAPSAPGGDAAPLLNFESLWGQFDEHYAFFELHGVDWRDAHRRFAPAVTAATPPQELFAIACRMLAPLDDGHVTLAGDGQVHQRMRHQALRAAMRATFGTPNGRVTPRTTVDAVSRQFDQVFLAPFTSRKPLQRAGNGIVSWCELAPGIGYLSVLRLFGFAESAAARGADDLPHTRAAVADFLRDDIAAFDAILDRVFSDLRACRALVLDLRLNGGGFDRAGLAIAARFADRRRLAFSKRARGAGQAQELHVEATAQPYLRPVVVLTSPLCVSAGEICVLGLRALPNVTIMGQPTAGMLSDNLNKPLPNGWELSLSNEIYTAADGPVFEGRGVPPGVPCAALAAPDFTGTARAALAAAVDRAGALA